MSLPGGLHRLHFLNNQADEVFIRPFTMILKMPQRQGHDVGSRLNNQQLRLVVHSGGGGSGVPGADREIGGTRRPCFYVLA
jgi:hypothetical protein